MSVRKVTTPPPPIAPTHRHASWIVSWALEKCVEEIEKVERQIMQHEYFCDEPYSSRHCLRQTRKETSDTLRDFLAQYRLIYTHLCQVKESIAQASAEEFAQTVSAMFGMK